jgi:hypothetical protein
MSPPRQVHIVFTNHVVLNDLVLSSSAGAGRNVHCDETSNGSKRPQNLMRLIKVTGCRSVMLIKV